MYFTPSICLRIPCYAAVMLESLDFRTVAALISIGIGVFSFLLYLVQILRKEAQPHIYTWLVWCITQGTATIAIFEGGGGLIGWSYGIGAGLVFIIFLLSFKYGTKNITPFDTFTLIAALAATLVWWQLDQPILAVLMVSAIDGLGYLPTVRKLWEEPWSEVLWTWGLFAFSNLIGIFALKAFNLLTLPYMVLCLVANAGLLVLGSIRRASVPKPRTLEI